MFSLCLEKSKRNGKEENERRGRKIRKRDGTRFDKRIRKKNEKITRVRTRTAELSGKREREKEQRLKIVNQKLSPAKNLVSYIGEIFFASDDSKKKMNLLLENEDSPSKYHCISGADSRISMHITQEL